MENNENMEPEKSKTRVRLLNVFAQSEPSINFNLLEISVMVIQLCHHDDSPLPLTLILSMLWTPNCSWVTQVKLNFFFIFLFFEWKLYWK